MKLFSDRTVHQNQVREGQPPQPTSTTIDVKKITPIICLDQPAHTHPMLTTPIIVTSHPETQAITRILGRSDMIAITMRDDLVPLMINARRGTIRSMMVATTVAITKIAIVVETTIISIMRSISEAAHHPEDLTAHHPEDLTAHHPDTENITTSLIPS